MDRRQQKTRLAIITAFNDLLMVEDYSNITIQEIIDKANIGRSTFYAHFETKDMLLTSLCSQVFHHIFSEELPEQSLLVPNTQPLQNLELQLSHILFHLKQSEIDINNILKGDGRKIFLLYFRKYIEELFVDYLQHSPVILPKDFLLNFLTESFISTTSWWVTSKSAYSPEEIAAYFIKVTHYNFIAMPSPM